MMYIRYETNRMGGKKQVCVGSNGLLTKANGKYTNLFKLVFGEQDYFLPFMFFPTSFLSRYYFSNKRAIILKQNKNQIITQTVKNKQKNKTKPCYHILLFPKCGDVRRDPCCDCLPDHLEPLLAIISSSCLNMLFKQGIKMLENSNFTPTFDIFRIIRKLSGGTLEFSKTF